MRAFRCLEECLGKEELIKRVIRDRWRKVIVKYYPDDHTIDVKVKSRFLPWSRKTGRTGLGAFTLARILSQAFKGVTPQRINYCVVGRNPREVSVKDRLFTRVLRNLGYTLDYYAGKFEKEGGRYFGPDRYWILKSG